MHPLPASEDSPCQGGRRAASGLSLEVPNRHESLRTAATRAQVTPGCSEGPRQIIHITSSHHSRLSVCPSSSSSPQAQPMVPNLRQWTERNEEPRPRDSSLYWLLVLTTPCAHHSLPPGPAHCHGSLFPRLKKQVPQSSILLILPLPPEHQQVSTVPHFYDRLDW